MRRLLTLATALLVGLALAAPRPASAAAPAAAPRVVMAGDAASKPVEVPISTKQVTLIHFDVGDVSMVAVGDPALVSVTVNGPDVLLRAQAFSGSTNAFIWAAGGYTQWRFVVREGNDPRVIVVKEGAAAAKPVTVTSAYRPAPTPPQPAPSPAPQAGSQPPAPPAAQPAPPGGPATSGGSALDRFLKTLNAKQLELFGAFLADLTLLRLAALVRELSPEQQKQLLALLAAPGVVEKASATPAQGAAVPPAPAAQSSAAPAPALPTGQPSAPPPVVAARVAVEAPSGVFATFTPQVVGRQIFLNYVLQNRGEATLLADGLRLRVLDRAGKRLGYVITRTSQDGYIGRLAPGGVEAGVITAETTEKVVVLEWTLVEVGTGAEQLLRAEVQVL
jgi:hypothetical protein